MKASVFLRSSALLLLTTCGLLHTSEGEMLSMRPLSAKEVYRMLRQTGRQDAVPAGRVVTQGLAAMTGFALGLTKAIGGVLLYDIITANVTAEMLNEGAATNAGSPAVSTQEICFSSRNARSLEEAHAIGEFYNAADRDDDENVVRQSGVKRRRNRPRRKKKHGRGKGKHKLVKRIKNRAGTEEAAATKLGTAAVAVTSNPTANTGATQTGSVISGGTQTANPTVTALNTGSAAVTNINAGSGTDTTSTSSTMTMPDGAINCLVIQKGR